MSFLIASSSYPIGTLSSYSELEDKLDRWVGQAKAEGASLALFPEYGAIEAALIEDNELAKTLDGQITLMDRAANRLISLWQKLARTYKITLVGPTIPQHDTHGLLVNRCYLVDQFGAVEFQDKMVPTVFERQEWGFPIGTACQKTSSSIDNKENQTPLNIFETEFGRLAVLTCYDCEFPHLAEAAVDMGAQILLVPSCTDTIAGYWRVRIGAMARALEGQCYVVQSSLVGEALWSPSTDVNIGMAGIFCPPDVGFPDGGIISLGKLNKAEWIFAEIDLEKLSLVRANGAVRGINHLKEQKPIARKVKLINLISSNNN